MAAVPRMELSTVNRAAKFKPVPDYQNCDAHVRKLPQADATLIQGAPLQSSPAPRTESHVAEAIALRSADNRDDSIDVAVGDGDERTSNLRSKPPCGVISNPLMLGQCFGIASRSVAR